MNKRTHELVDLDADGIELSADELKLVLGGLPRQGTHSSKVCDVGGGCWSDTDF